MGKDLKGKEIGKGICRKKDGKYLARFVGRSGKRIEKCFNSVPEARNWLSEAQYADKHSNLQTTMDRYVHVSAESMLDAIEKLEENA